MKFLTLKCLTWAAGKRSALSQVAPSPSPGHSHCDKLKCDRRVFFLTWQAWGTLSNSMMSDGGRRKSEDRTRTSLFLEVLVFVEPLDPLWEFFKDILPS